jgi:hypothetical protein
MGQQEYGREPSDGDTPQNCYSERQLARDFYPLHGT